MSRFKAISHYLLIMSSLKIEESKKRAKAPFLRTDNLHSFFKLKYVDVLSF